MKYGILLKTMDPYLQIEAIEKVETIFHSFLRGHFENYVCLLYILRNLQWYLY